MVQTENVEKTPRHGVLGRYKTGSTKRIDTLPAYCIPKVVVMESGEIIYEKVCVSPRPPPKISFKDNWMKELDSDVAGSSKDSQRIQPKLKTQLSRTERPVSEDQKLKNGETCGWTTIHPELCAKDEDADENVDAYQTRTGRPVSGQSITQLEALTSECKDCHMQL